MPTLTDQDIAQFDSKQSPQGNSSKVLTDDDIAKFDAAPKDEHHQSLKEMAQGEVQGASDLMNKANTSIATLATGKSFADRVDHEIPPATSRPFDSNVQAATANYGQQVTKDTIARTADQVVNPANMAFAGASTVAGGLNKAGEVLSPLAKDISARIQNNLVRLPLKAYRYGKDPMAVFTKENITGNTLTDYAQNAEERLGQRSKELNTAIAGSDKSVNLDEIINKHLDQANSSAEGSLQDRTGVLKKIQDLKDKIGEQYGSDLSNMSVQDAVKLKRQLADDFPFTAGDVEGNIMSKTAHKIYHDINDAVEAAHPEIADLNGRVSGLIDITKAANNRVAVESRNNPIGLIQTILGAGTGAAAVGHGAGAMVGGGIGVATALMAKAMTSPAVLTRVAKALSMMSNADKISLFKAMPEFMSVAQAAHEFEDSGSIFNFGGSKLGMAGKVGAESATPVEAELMPNQPKGLPSPQSPRNSPRYPSSDPTVNEQGLPLVHDVMPMSGASKAATEDLSTAPKTAPDSGPIRPNSRAGANMSKNFGKMAIAAGGATALGASNANAMALRPKVVKEGQSYTGQASTYGWGEKLNKNTFSGEKFDPKGVTVAMRNVPMGSTVEVKDNKTGKVIEARVNDGGPGKRTHRVVDLSQGAWKALGYQRPGLASVTVKVKKIGGGKQYNGKY